MGESPLFSFAEISFPGSIQLIENMVLEVDRVSGYCRAYYGLQPGLEIVDVEARRRSKHRMLRVFIDRPAQMPTPDHPAG